VALVRRREFLFSAWWTDAAGQRLRRATQAELAEANRLWWKHRDLRQRSSGTKYARVILIDDAEGELEGAA
jgi:hypothetical protein